MRIKKILIFLIPIFLILFFWKDTILHLSTHLYSWFDGPFVIWIFQNNIRHFSTLNLSHLFETNAMYPFPLSLSFTDHMFFPALLIWIISWFNSNPIFQFNILAILNHLLIYVCFYLFAGRFTKNFYIKILVSFFTAFSPYFLGQIGHLQMIFFWPFLLSLYFISNPKRNLINVALTGFWLGLQFLSAVYLGLMGFGIIALYYFFHGSKKGPVGVAKEIGVFIFVFFLTSFPSIYGYLAMQKMYKPVFEQGQYVTYAAHISDYIFIFINNSFLNNNLLRPFIGVFNHHNRGEFAGFVGFVPLGIFIFVILNSFKNLKKNKILKKFQHDKSILVWLGLLIFIGFICSLGPRMNWNGRYLVTPLPYWFVIIFIPVIGVMRAVARWYFLVIFAVSILLIYGLEFINLMIRNSFFKKLFFPIVFLLLIFEYYPIPLSDSARNWQSPVYLYLQKACKSKPGAVLEYPFEYRYKADDIVKYLSLKTNTLMSSTLHDCPTLSGFSSFEPTLFKKWQEDFDTNGITDSNIKILRDNKFVFVKVNLKALSTKEQQNPSMYIHTKDLEELYRDKEAVIYKIN